jgi:hypothetical protein
VPFFLFSFAFSNFFAFGDLKKKQKKNILLKKKLEKKKKTWPNFQGKKKNWGIYYFFHIMTEFLVLG